MTMRRRASAVALAVSLAVVLAACGGDDDDSDSAGGQTDTEESTTTAAEATTTTLSPEHEVLAAYDRADQALVAAYDPANPQHPELLATWGGDALARHQTYLTSYQLEGLSDVAVVKERNPTIVTVGESSATIQDCIHETLQLMNSQTREPQGAPRDYTLLIEYQLERIEGTWKVIEGETVEETC